jgi:MFS family permease
VSWSLTTTNRFGYDTGYISGLKEMPYFLSVYGELQGDGTYILPSKTDSLITSILSAGTFFGALLASTVGDYLGRRKGIMAYIGKLHFLTTSC